MEEILFLPHLLFATEEMISIGPVEFHISPTKGVKLHISKKLPKLEQYALAQDAIYIFYFTLNAQRIYFDQPPLPLKPFVQISRIPLAVENKCTADALALDKGLLEAFGKILLHSGCMPNHTETGHMVQSIRFFVERYFPKFEELSEVKPELSRNALQDIILLGLSFEVLFQLNPSNPIPDLRQKLRPLLHLKFSRPVELLWKWVEQFYITKENAKLGKNIDSLIFNENPNLTVPLVTIGEKLFIYSIYELLFHQNLISGLAGSPSTPDDFLIIHPSRVLLYLWPEENILRKLSLCLTQIQANKALVQNRNDLQMLCSIWLEHKKLQKQCQRGELPPLHHYTGIQPESYEEQRRFILDCYAQDPSLFTLAFIDSLH